jgi:hypothetical protein
MPTTKDSAPGLSPFTCEGRTMTGTAWQAETGIERRTIQKRIQRGMTVASALATDARGWGITPLSAALTLQSWTEAHQRPPLYAECRASQGLYWATTYFRCFQVSSFVSALQAASAILASATPRVMKPCCNAPECTSLIVDEGPHIRFCEKCRSRARGQNQEYMEPAFTRTRLERWGVGRDGWGWQEDIDWNGSKG